MSEVILKVDGLHKYFDENHVLRGIDLEVKQSETICLIGSSGSGKSTFLRCINFMEYPSAGRIAIHGDVIGYCMRPRGWARREPFRSDV